MISVEVTDPHKMICDIRLVESTDKLLMLMIDLTGEGKRAESGGVDKEENSFALFVGEIDSILTATVKVIGLLFEEYHFFTTSGRYTFTATFVGRGKEPPEILYTGKE